MLIVTRGVWFLTYGCNKGEFGAARGAFGIQFIAAYFSNVQVIHVEPVPHASSQDSGVGSSLKSKHDFIETLFGVSLKTLEDIDAFAKAVEAGNYTVWDTLDDDVVQRVQDAIDGLWKALKVSPSAMASPSALALMP
ncbi:hypothetical protein CTI12_AA152530 [Artemisia annua]|uniref:Uncharacterized protein n=1 Tax=Artemisia annua TaxID=35608 RepID=A0A2U1N1S6_ARTAN|nr:hypothetical protein CTI12_AA152530 [Artemisia annua]